VFSCTQRWSDVGWRRNRTGDWCLDEGKRVKFE
jgi:hypothetical protein